MLRGVSTVYEFVTSGLAGTLGRMFGHVFGRSEAKILLESGGEVVGIDHAHGVSHLRHGDVSLLEEPRSLLHSQVAYELADGYPRHLLHPSVQLNAAKPNLGGQRLDVEVAV